MFKGASRVQNVTREKSRRRHDLRDFFGWVLKHIFDVDFDPNKHLQARASMTYMIPVGGSERIAPTFDVDFDPKKHLQARTSISYMRYKANV